MVLIKCTKCGKEWDYSGNALYATCPSCLSKVRVDQQSQTVEDLSDVIVNIALLERSGKKLDRRALELINELKGIIEAEKEKQK